MKLSEISNLRLVNQQVIASNYKTAKELVGWMGVMQAQDFNMAKLAVGIRTTGSTETAIEKAINDGDIIRTHVLRPTWHFVTPENIGWMLDLSSEKIKAVMRSSDKQLGITEEIYKKSNPLFEKVLEKAEYLTREELKEVLSSNNIDTSEFRVSHLLMRAELEKIICSGRIIDGKQTYSLYAKRISSEEKISREEALYRLAKRYFLSHGPATVADFMWWSGLTAGETKKGVEQVKDQFMSISIDGNTYLFSPDIVDVKIEKELFFLLPAFDEFIISYRDRSPSIASANMSRAIYINGIFRPVIVFEGEVIGIWQRNQKKNKIEVNATYFNSINNKIEDRFGKEVERLSMFWGKPVTISHR
jgi:hypothetical protein